MEVEKRPDLSVQLSGIELKNPVILASGTCGFGEEIAEFIDLNKVGAIVTKTVTLDPKEGNPPPRIAEVEGGIVNSIGLENPGVEEFISGKLPFLKGLQTPFFVSISGNTVNEFQRLAAILDKEKSISAVELNLSCPNITHGNCLFAQDPKISYQTIKKVKEATSLPVIAKLSPQVTDITSIALACQDGGADILCLMNTIPALVIDREAKRPFLGGITGGLSGPAIKPIALKMVFDVAGIISIPIIGCGGIMNGDDAIDFLLTGASAVAIGTSNLISPDSTLQIIEEIEDYIIKHKFNAIKELIGKLELLRPLKSQSYNSE